MAIGMELAHGPSEPSQQPVSTSVPDFHSSALSSTGVSALNGVHGSSGSESRQSQGVGGASLSLFDDPLLQLGMFESSSSAVSTADSLSVSAMALSDSSELNVALEYFPALRESMGRGRSHVQNSGSDGMMQFQGDVQDSIGISATNDVLNKHEDESHGQYLEHSSSHSSLSGRNKQGLPSVSLSAENELNFDPYAHHSSKSTSALDNWPEISNRHPTQAPLHSNQSSNEQGHENSAPMNSQVSGATSQGSGGFVVEAEALSLQVEDNPHPVYPSEAGAMVQQASMREPSGNGPHSVPGQMVSELQVSAANPHEAKSPQENAGMLVHSDTSSFSNGMDPNLMSNPYITNGDSSEVVPESVPQLSDMPTSLPTSPPLSDLNTPTSATISQSQQPSVSRAPTAANSSAEPRPAPFIPYTSLSDQGPQTGVSHQNHDVVTCTSPADSPLRPTAPSFHPQFTIAYSNDSMTPSEATISPFECLFCYQSFMSPEALREHCKSPAHVELLLQDCSARSIWKHPPPPPPTDEGTSWEFCERLNVQYIMHMEYACTCVHVCVHCTYVHVYTLHMHVNVYIYM